MVVSTLSRGYVSQCARAMYMSVHDPSYPVVTDPEDPRFDLEKLFAKWESES